MCKGCWERYGEPKIVNESVLAATEAVYNVYDYVEMGGELHVQLDDWNLEDHFFDESQYCRLAEHPLWTEHMSLLNAAKLRLAEVQCFLLFRDLSIEERASALALASKYFSADK